MPAWLPQIAGYALSAACLVWVLHNYPIRELPAAIRSLDWGWVALGIAADLAVYMTHAWRWNTLLSPVSRLGYWRTVQAIYIGLFANEVLPRKYGFPMKLRMPTKLGYKNPKHIVDIFVTNTYPGGYWSDQGYNWFGGS